MSVRTPFDYNGDGFSDIWWFNSSAGQSTIWNMANDQFLAQQTVAANVIPGPAGTFAQPFSPESGDFNGDGITDIFQYNFNTGQATVQLFRNDQINQTVSLPTVTPGIGWAPVLNGDFNGDGTADILWHNFNTNANLIWLLNSQAQWSSQSVLPSTTNNWSPLATGDFNGDGTADILFHDSSSGANVVWNMSSGMFASQSVLPTTTNNWSFGGAGDLNGDGTTDLLWHNVATQQNVDWGISNSQFATQSVLPSTANSWVPELGNFGGDATSEIFWHNATATGENVIWTISNLNWSGQVALPSVPNPPWFEAHQIGVNI